MTTDPTMTEPGEGEKPSAAGAEPAAAEDTRRDWRKNPPRCPYCNGRAKLLTGDFVYVDRPDLAKRLFWACMPCGAWCGVHGNSARAAPLGTLADADLRRMRRQVHDLLDPLWRDGGMARADAYAWLARRLGMDVRRCHVGFFREAQCLAVLAILKQREAQRR